MGAKRDKPKIEKKPEDTMMTCPQCKCIHKAQPFCPSCGNEYPKRQAVEHVAGTLKELLSAGSSRTITAAVWPQVCAFARERDKTKPSPKKDGGRGYALWLYHEMVGEFPKDRGFELTAPVAPSADVLGKIKSIQIRSARRHQIQGARV